MGVGARVAAARRKLRRGAWVVRRFLAQPAVPVRSDGRLLVHLGCGEIDAPGWVNVDVQRLPHVHHVSDVRRLPMFATGSIDLLYACHVLEHVSFRETRETLAEWHRVLKPGGTLRLSVPDFDLLVDLYVSQGREAEKIARPLLGGQRESHNFHQAIFTERSLGRGLLEVGFRRVERWEAATAPDYGLDDWASRTFEFEGREYPISLNLEAVK